MSAPRKPPGPPGGHDLRFVAAAGGATLAAALRAQFPEKSWSAVRALCASGKVRVDGKVMLDPAQRLAGDETITLTMNAPDVRKHQAPPGFRILFEDGHLIIIEKPEGVSSVPYDRKETGTALDLIRNEWRRQGRPATQTPLYTVHRIDKDTSGLLCFAKTRLAEKGLHDIFQQHLAERTYIAIAHGHVLPGRIESMIVADRGDGIRGSARHVGQGQRAVTHVAVDRVLPRATVCRVKLETGRTHQIRIHLAERGHPLVGETVYIRDLLRQGGTPLPSARLLLHAATLGFKHPVTGAQIAFSCELPPSFVAEQDRLAGDGVAGENQRPARPSR